MFCDEPPLEPWLGLLPLEKALLRSWPAMLATGLCDEPPPWLGFPWWRTLLMTAF